MSASTAGSLLAGRYQLEVPLGRGGFGQVWRARDVVTRRLVAVKLVELTEITDPALLGETIARFRREATTVAALRHPNIVAAYDAGRIGGELFLVMELAEGASLAAVLDRRAAGGMGLFPVASVLAIAEQACAGLGAAHAVGVVHRDIKPGNLMVATRLQVKIIDFGIARLLADNSPRLTLPSHAIGTAEYMSPEQAGGGDVDGRADLYSLGCVLYELLAGVPPFTAADPSEVLMMQLSTQAVPLGARRADLPAGLPELVDDLMAKHKVARPADAWQVIARIGAIRAALEATGADRAEPVHEADRATVLKPDLLAGPTGDYASADGGDDDDPVVSDRTVTALPSETGAAATPATPATPGTPGTPSWRGGRGAGVAAAAEAADAAPAPAHRGQHADHRRDIGWRGRIRLGAHASPAAQGHRRRGHAGAAAGHPVQCHGGCHRHDLHQRQRRAGQLSVGSRRGDLARHHDHRRERSVLDAGSAAVDLPRAGHRPRHGGTSRAVPRSGGRPDQVHLRLHPVRQPRAAATSPAQSQHTAGSQTSGYECKRAGPGRGVPGRRAGTTAPVGSGAGSSRSRL